MACEKVAHANQKRPLGMKFSLFGLIKHEQDLWWGTFWSGSWQGIPVSKAVLVGWCFGFQLNAQMRGVPPHPRNPVS